jgi:cytochrome P450
MTPVPREPVIIDGGGRACVRLLLELRSRISGLPGGTVIHLFASDPAAPIDLPAWCHLTGQEPALVTAAVEEILRAAGQGGGGIPRYARAGLRIADVTIRPGDLVLLDNGAANHDRTAFIDPERFDISRPAVPHLSFGHGARYCIGAPLARIELQSVFSQLIPRFPGMRLAEPAAQLTFNRDTLAGGLARLPVTW